MYLTDEQWNAMKDVAEELFNAQAEWGTHLQSHRPDPKDARHYLELDLRSGLVHKRLRDAERAYEAKRKEVLGF